MSERLTDIGDVWADNDFMDCGVAKYFNKLTAYEDCFPLERAQELAAAEREGRLVVLPCKVGDTVYCKRTSCDGCEYAFVNDEFCGELRRCGKHIFVERPFEARMIGGFGKTVFLTREAAEAAMNGGDWDA